MVPPPRQCKSRGARGRSGQDADVLGDNKQYPADVDLGGGAYAYLAEFVGHMYRGLMTVADSPLFHGLEAGNMNRKSDYIISGSIPAATVNMGTTIWSGRPQRPQQEQNRELGVVSPHLSR
jgi:hypothetical protein